MNADSTRFRSAPSYYAVASSKPIRDLVETMRDAGEPLAEALIETLVRFGVGLVGNQVGGGHDGVVMQRISRMISDYLLVHAPVLAMVPRSDAVRASVAARRPLVLGDDGGEAAAQLRGLARAVMEVELPGRGGRAPAPTVPLWIERDGEPDRDAAAAPAR